MTSLKEFVRGMYMRSRFVRHVGRWVIPGKRAPLDFSHILSLPENAIGPVHRDEALFLFGLTRVLCPKTIVEFGFMVGHSALNFLLAAGPDCKVFSYDVAENPQRIARRCFGGFKNFRFIRKSQSEFSPADIENRKIDLCFIDASHDLVHNLRSFELIRPHLSETAIIAVHDTGTWCREFFTQRHRTFVSSEEGANRGRWLDADHFQQVEADRIFVNEVLRKYPDFSQIHLHSAHTLRNGITLLQRSAPLATGTEAGK